MTVPLNTDTTATLTYLTPLPNGKKPWLNINASKTSGEPESNYTKEQHTLPVRNIRDTKEKIGIDVTGFDVKRIPSAFAADWTNFSDEARIKAEYYPEIEAILKDATGASEVFIFDHTIRRRNPGVADDSPDKRQPVALVHIDQTPKAAEQRVRRHLGDRADELLKRRYQLINIWRPIQNNASDYPLAVCAYPSLDQKDLVPTDLLYPDPIPNGETYNVTYNPNQQFYYCKDQTPEEVTFIKCFDSNTGVARLTPHTAFEDPNTPKDAPLRQSIEVRCLVFHD